MFAFLTYRTGDWTLSEDLLADTFEKVLRSRRPPPSGAGEKPWLYTVALNAVRDSARRRGVEQRAYERMAGERTPTDDAGGALEVVAERDEVRHALALLSAEEREAIALRFGAGLTVPELASALGVSLTTAEGRVYRGLRKLRAELTRE